MKRLISLAVLGLTLAASASASVFAQDIADIPINETTSLYCRDNSGDPRLMTYSNLGNVMRRYDSRFHFDMSVEPGKPLILKFARPADSPFSITYKVTPYKDVMGRKGLVLETMHIFLDNADRDIEGSAMCYFTEFGK